MVAFESLGHISVLSSTLESNNGDVISGDMVDFGEDDFLMEDLIMMIFLLPCLSQLFHVIHS